MVRMRHIAPLIAATLAVVILVEMSNLARCPDDAVSTHQIDAVVLIAPNATPFLVDHVFVTLHDHDGRTPENSVAAHCLCNIPFISTVANDCLGRPHAIGSAHAVSNGPVTEGEVLVPSPVPLT